MGRTGARGNAAGFSQSIDRGLAILASFRSGSPLLGVSELARGLGLRISTTHRYVATLAELGYLEQDRATRKYRLGPRVLDLGFSAINSMGLRGIATPHLQQLSEETGYTVNMAILDGVEVVYVERCRSRRAGQQEIDLDLYVGARLPVYCTSLGKVLLAFRSDDEVRALLGRMELRSRGPNTLTSRPAFLAELARVRRDGIAVNNEELAYGLRSIAAPIRDRSGEVVAAINMAVHRSMGIASTDEVVSRLGPALRRAANTISARVGYVPVPA